MDPNPQSLRENNLKQLWVPRVLWWDLGNHGRARSSTLEVDLEVFREQTLPPGALEGVDLVVAEAHDVQKEGIRRHLGFLLKNRGRPPVLLLTTFQPENVRFIQGLPVEDVAWTSEPIDEVLARGLRLVRGTERRRVAEYLLRSCSDPSTVELVVKNLFLNPKPPSQVQELARRCFLDRRALERKWNAAWSGSPPLPLKALVDLGLLLRGTDLKEGGLRHDQVAKALGIHQRTLDRIACRLAGFSFRRWFTSKNRAVLQTVGRGFRGDR